MNSKAYVLEVLPIINFYKDIMTFLEEYMMWHEIGIKFLWGSRVSV